MVDLKLVSRPCVYLGTKEEKIGVNYGMRDFKQPTGQ